MNGPMSVRDPETGRVGGWDRRPTYDGPESANLETDALRRRSNLRDYVFPYNNVKTIVQTDDHMMLNIEWMHFTRVFRMNDEHRPSNIMSLAGDSVGWWEGDTAVIESTNFMQERNQPMEGYRLIEKFTPTEGGLIYYFRVEDPGYEAPYAGEMYWPRTQDFNYEFACHEGNYYMGNMLGGASTRKGVDVWSSVRRGRVMFLKSSRNYCYYNNLEAIWPNHLLTDFATGFDPDELGWSLAGETSELELKATTSIATCRTNLLIIWKVHMLSQATSETL